MYLEENKQVRRRNRSMNTRIKEETFTSIRASVTHRNHPIKEKLYPIKPVFF